QVLGMVTERTVHLLGSYDRALDDIKRRCGVRMLERCKPSIRRLTVIVDERNPFALRDRCPAIPILARAAAKSAYVPDVRISVPYHAFGGIVATVVRNDDLKGSRRHALISRVEAIQRLRQHRRSLIRRDHDRESR